MEQFNLTVRTEIEALEEILQWFEKVAQPHLSQKPLWECKLALAEGFTNTVRYAHQDLPSSVPIILEVEIYPSFIEIKIINMGPVFDLQGKLKELQKSKANPLEKESDRGLFFMKELTDNLQYIRIANRCNYLVMRKNLNSKESNR